MNPNQTNYLTINHCYQMLEYLCSNEIQKNRWLNSPNQAFDLVKPIDVLQSNPQAVYEYLSWIIDSEGS